MRFRAGGTVLVLMRCVPGVCRVVKLHRRHPGTGVVGPLLEGRAAGRNYARHVQQSTVKTV